VEAANASSLAGNSLGVEAIWQHTARRYGKKPWALACACAAYSGLLQNSVGIAA
jgi:hypothetical protein